MPATEITSLPPLLPVELRIYISECLLDILPLLHIAKLAPLSKCVYSQVMPLLYRDLVLNRRNCEAFFYGLKSQPYKGEREEWYKPSIDPSSSQSTAARTLKLFFLSTSVTIQDVDALFVCFTPLRLIFGSFKLPAPPEGSWGPSIGEWPVLFRNAGREKGGLTWGSDLIESVQAGLTRDLRYRGMADWSLLPYLTAERTESMTFVALPSEWSTSLVYFVTHVLPSGRVKKVVFGECEPGSVELDSTEFGKHTFMEEVEIFIPTRTSLSRSEVFEGCVHAVRNLAQSRKSLRTITSHNYPLDTAEKGDDEADRLLVAAERGGEGVLEMRLEDIEIVLYRALPPD
ncbi:hypothetical protein L202_08069 [Cryptococcus amylolentus CBS 6039]|uniref:Uncharacterized protein n=1 Tax=Cryptococcus amylolentus CBS 6039 TaxID=1295533 RepID=A0A1E3HB56_9TREE|nr:hypothetical protein L202_08069 [Cryptococcus amylolentus CBS 6039]ODN73569.1 hypothetical protein L202_08069 [Cryptococcus amylolentus CBS 6039]